MTELAPTAIALVTSPEYRTPPSEMIGISQRLATSEHSCIDVIIGMPIPATTRVVQIEPEPIPIFTASTPRSISAWVASHVATFQAIKFTEGYAALSFPIIFMTPAE